MAKSHGKCIQCGSFNTSFYEGMLGFEGIKCNHCGYVRDIWEKANARGHAFQLGFMAGAEKPTSINYSKNMRIPYNSFSHPNIQVNEYLSGFRQARRKWGFKI